MNVCLDCCVPRHYFLFSDALSVRAPCPSVSTFHNPLSLMHSTTVQRTIGSEVHRLRPAQTLLDCSPSPRAEPERLCRRCLRLYFVSQSCRQSPAQWRLALFAGSGWIRAATLFAVRTTSLQKVVRAARAAHAACLRIVARAPHRAMSGEPGPNARPPAAYDASKGEQLFKVVVKRENADAAEVLGLVYLQKRGVAWDDRKAAIV